jgi:hypothetical protein
MDCNFGGYLNCNGNYSISGSAPTHFSLSQAGNLNYDGTGGGYTITITLSGTPNFSTCFAFCLSTASMVFTGTTFVGGATGTRFLCQYGAFIDTNGAGVNFFPGSVAGVTTQAYYL